MGSGCSRARRASWRRRWPPSRARLWISRRRSSPSCATAGTDLVRWLLLKDLQILRRSPLLVTLLVLYPILIAALVGFAVTSGPSKPRVAILNEVPPSANTIDLGGQRVNVSK